MTPITIEAILAAEEQERNELAYEKSANGFIKGKEEQHE
jgi:hypothetical protein